MYQPEQYKDVWMQTFTGRAVPVMCMGVDDLDIEDIAHSLANQCRFNGHVSKFYSVAQHSVIVSNHVPAEYALEGLLHDAPEAYIGDMIRPLKHSGLLNAFRDIDDNLWKTVANKWRLPATMSPAVKEHDARSLLTEQRDLLGRQAKPWEDVAEPYPETIVPLTPRQSKLAFLARFKELTDELL